MKGLEPPRRETQDPKSCAATNYATPAGIILTKFEKTECKVTDFFCFILKKWKKNKSFVSSQAELLEKQRAYLVKSGIRGKRYRY
jgi:hypothetical protein